MGKRRNLWDSLADSGDLPGETLPGQSILELLGDNRILIESHRGVIQYSPEEIGIRLKFGSVFVCGCYLELIQMTRGQLVIRGKIETIRLHRGR